MKKALVLLLTLILLVVPFSVSVCAAKEPTIVVSSVAGNAGDTVKVTISTQNNPGIISLKALLKYDSKAIDLVDYEVGEFAKVTFSPKESNPFVINWIDPLNPNNNTNGVLATITFKILNTAPNGKSEISLSYNPDDVFNSEMNNVNFAVENGYVDITNPNPPQDIASQNGASQDTSSDVLIDTTGSTILENALSSANQSVSDSNSLQDPPQDNDWIIWVVVGAIVVLIGGFAVVIIKDKKEE